MTLFERFKLLLGGTIIALVILSRLVIATCESNYGNSHIVQIVTLILTGLAGLTLIIDAFNVTFAKSPSIADYKLKELLVGIASISVVSLYFLLTGLQLNHIACYLCPIVYSAIFPLFPAFLLIFNLIQFNKAPYQ